MHLQFPDILWNLYEYSLFSQAWGAYTLSFERVLVQWEAGDFDQTRPAEPQPRGGLLAAIMWSRTRGEAKQRKLVGMTAYAEVGDLDHPVLVFDKWPTNEFGGSHVL